MNWEFLLKNTPKHEANIQTKSGCTPGEVKLAITLRVLAGGSCLDLVPFYDIGCKCSRTTFTHVLTNWTNRDKISEINFFNCLNRRKVK